MMDQKRRNRFQFRLRTLMLATACVFLATPWVAESWIQSYREQGIWAQYNEAIQSRDHSLAEWREASTNARKIKAQEKFETTDAEVQKLFAKIKMFYDFDVNPLRKMRINFQLQFGNSNNDPRA